MSFAQKPSSKAAFTLLELSLVLGVISLLIAGIMTVVTQNARRAATAEVNRKMDVIEAHLLDFSRANGRLPCPADSTMLINTQYFGIEGTPTGDCTNGSTYNNASDYPADGGSNVPPDATFNYAFMAAGDVPVKTIGLSDDYMFDPWGGRFYYVVDSRMTAISAFTTYTVTSATGCCLVYDGSTYPAFPGSNTRSNTVIVLLMSYGPDGHGAFQLSGARKAIGNTNADTQLNCHCDVNGSTSAYTPNRNAFFVQHPATATSPNDPTNFDDIVRFYTRQSFLSSTDIITPR